MSNIIHRISVVLADMTGLDINEFDSSTVLDSIDFDDLDLVQFMMRLDKEFDIELNDDQIMMNHSLSEIAEEIQRRIDYEKGLL